VIGLAHRAFVRGVTPKRDFIWCHAQSSAGPERVSALVKANSGH
jgi:hypothetical protein